MKKIKLILITFSVFCFVACQEVDHAESITKINSFISENSSNYKSLTTGYHFKLYKDGVGEDLSRPIHNDTIILLKNNFSNQFPVSEINDGRINLLDSAEICKLSYEHDQKRLIMRSFLIVSYKNKSKKLKIDLRNWAPQYTQDEYKCIEVSLRSR